MSKYCNWCYRKGCNISTKPYCDLCAKTCKRECKVCHRPFDNLLKNFTLDDERCDACYKKYLKRRKPSQLNNKSILLQNIIMGKDVYHVSESEDDVLAIDEETPWNPEKRKKVKRVAEEDSGTEDPPRKKRMPYKKKPVIMSHGDTTDEEGDTEEMNEEQELKPEQVAPKLLATQGRKKPRQPGSKNPATRPRKMTPEKVKLLTDFVHYCTSPRYKVNNGAPITITITI